MSMTNKIGFFRKTKQSNEKLVVLFEKIQKIRSESTDNDWLDKKFINKLETSEKSARKKVLNMLKNKKLKTADDFLRAGDIFHHGKNFKTYMIAVALTAISSHLGEPWAKNHYAVALDRLLISLGLPQHFGSQFIMKNGKWKLDKTDLKTTDKERIEYGIEPIKILEKSARDMDKGITSWETSLKD